MEPNIERKGAGWMKDIRRRSLFSRCACAVVIMVMALGLAAAAPPARTAQAAPVPPANNIPPGWPWKINNIAYPTLGYPQMVKRGGSFTLEFDCNGRASGTGQPDVEDWDVRLLSSNDRFPTVVDCPVTRAVRATSARWARGHLPPSAVNGEWSGPWAGKEVWQVTVKVPSGSRADLYDLHVTAEGAGKKTDSQPHAVQVVERFKDDYEFVQISDFHINDPRGPSDSFIPGKYPNPSQFKNYQYNSKAIQDVNRINPDFVIMTGDLPFGYPAWANLFCGLLDPANKRTDFTGAASDWDGEYNQAYRQLLDLEVPVVCIPGNHDAYNLQSQLGDTIPHTHGQPQDGAHIWHTMIGPRFLSWDYGDKFHLTGIFAYDKIQRDPNILVQNQRSSIPVVHTPPADGGSGWMRPNQKQWAKNDLAASRGKYDFGVIGCHNPFYGEAGWDTWEDQAIMDELMQWTRDYDVELAITGHTHRDDRYIDRPNPADPSTWVYHLNTTTTSFGTIEYPGFRRLFVEDGKLKNHNYKPPFYSYPTYKDTQIKRHAKAKDAEKALAHLDVPSVVGTFSSDDPFSIDKQFQCTNYFTEGDPPVTLDDTVVEFVMADMGEVGRYDVTGGTLTDWWKPKTGHVTLRVRLDAVAPSATTTAAARALFIASASPGRARPGGTLDVDITGLGTSFSQGSSRVAFSGGGIFVNSVQVHNRNSLTASVTVSPDAVPGKRDVNVVTGSERPQPLTGGFTVEALTPAVVACFPEEVVQGHEVDLHVVGGNTHFSDGASRVEITGDGIDVGKTTASDATHAGAHIKIGITATPGPRDVNVVTGAEVPHPLEGGINVHAKPALPPFIHEMDPLSGPVGTYVKLLGGNFGEARGSSVVTFNGVEVSEYVSWTDSEIKCYVPFGASTGPVKVLTPWGVSEGEDFTVTASEFNFAEGTCRPGFEPYFCIQNPEDSEADVKITYMKGDATTAEQAVTVGAHTRATVNVRDFLGEGDDAAHDFSARVKCTNGLQIIVERPMYFAYQGAWSGGSDVVGAPTASGEFYFAEGTCRPGFDSYICVQNPGRDGAQVKITYMTGDGTNREQEIVVAPQSRATVTAKDFLGEVNDAAHDFSAKVESTNGVGILAERPMYFDYQGYEGYGWTGGHDVIGALEPERAFYFAEGTCRPGFDPYICVQNPDGCEAHVKITYMLGDGATREQQAVVAGLSRQTFKVRDFLGVGDDPAHDFSALVETTNGRRIVAERPMYFSYGEGWTGGSDVVGSAGPATAFYFAEGTCRPGFDSYLCVQNPSLAHADVKITYMLGDGTVKEQSLNVKARSRSTVKANDFIGSGVDPEYDFSAVVESTNGIPIVAERPMYFAYDGNMTGGHDVVGF
jgi:3',5'-cyclic AMP phosphodiesterase CpdA